MGLYKKVKRGLRKAGAALKKRYMAKPGGRKSTGGVRVAKMAKDIMYLKSVLNPEKKRFEAALDVATKIGQINATNPAGTVVITDGSYFIDCTPVPTQGVTYSTRNGASIKLHSSIWHFQFVQELNTISEIKLTLELFDVDGETYTGFNYIKERYLVNPFVKDTISGTPIGVRDKNSQINPDNFMKGKCIARRNLTLKADTVSGARNIIDLKLPVLYNKGKGHHVRFDKDGQAVEHGQLLLCIRADRGNIGTVTATNVTGVPDTAVNTGCNVVWNRVDYFYDN